VTGAGDPRVAYCTVEDVASALDLAPGARRWRQIARTVLASSTDIEGLLNRRFYPYTDVRYFDWPLNGQHAVPWRVWLDQHEVLSVDRIVTGGVTLQPGTHFILRPENTGPPFSHVEIRLDSGAMWATGANTWQQAIAVHGVFGGCGDTEPVAELAAPVDTTTGAVTVTDSSTVGTLDTLLVGDEWMTVNRRSMTGTGATLTADATASPGGTVLALSDGALVHPDEVLLIGGERVQVLDVAGDTAVVKRAVDGSVLAAHPAGTAVYAPRALAVTRGVLGSTAAGHQQGDAAARLAPPEAIRTLAIAESIHVVQQDSIGWSTSKGEEGRVTQFRDLNDLRNAAYTRWARQSRIRAV